MVPARDARAELGELFRVARRTGVMRLHAALHGGEAVREREAEVVERGHLAIEPLLPARPIAVRPRQACAQIRHAELAQPPHRFIEAVVFEMEPLADAYFGRVLREEPHRTFWRAIFAQQSHVEVAVVRRTLFLPVAPGGR